MNKLILIGNLGSDPETITLENGTKITKFSLATNESYKNKQGEKVTEVTWHNIVSFGKQAEVLEKYLTKGDKISIVGKIKNRSWETESREKKYITEVTVNEFEFISTKSSNSTTVHEAGVMQPVGENQDDLPF